MVVTVLTSDADGNPPDGADSRGWANLYGSSHPVLADNVGNGGLSRSVMSGGYAFPFYMLLDRGMVIETLAEGAESITEEEVLSLL